MTTICDASVVICTYNAARWPTLCKAVESVRAQTVTPQRLVIVVDHEPQLLEKTRDSFPDAVVVPNPFKCGASGTRNAGVAETTGKVVAFLDDDAIAEPDWLERLFAAYDDESVVAAGGRVLPSWEQRRPRWFPEEFDWVVGCSYRGMPVTRTPVRNMIGANMSFRREVLVAAGPFDEGLGRVGLLPFGDEETDMCIRLRQQQPGSIVLHEPGAVVRHHVTSSRATWAYFRSRCMAEGVSKAQLVKSIGSADGLSEERTHSMHILPHGFARGLADTLSGRNRWGAAQAAAIAAGFAVTATGYILGRAGLPTGTPSHA